GMHNTDRCIRHQHFNVRLLIINCVDSVMQVKHLPASRKFPFNCFLNKISVIFQHKSAPGTCFQEEFLLPINPGRPSDSSGDFSESASPLKSAHRHYFSSV